MYYGLKQGQITPNIENRYVLKIIHLVAQYSKITNTVLFLKITYFSAFCCFLLVMLECPKVHFVALRFNYIFEHNVCFRSNFHYLNNPLRVSYKCITFVVTAYMHVRYRVFVF